MDSDIGEFQAAVWEYYDANGRTMPWRVDHSPYRVLVSELMLQQTQVARVIPKFEAFLRAFPTIVSLADASLADVLTLWQGLGYNRRARYLHEAAKKIRDEYGGTVPDTVAGLTGLPGIGPNTAGAILAYAFGTRTLFIETNVRTVLFHHFFSGGEIVGDRELTDILERTTPEENVREWYWALMDYGAHLKSTAGGRLDQSSHYRKQSPLRGSIREVRGAIVRVLSGGGSGLAELRSDVGADERFDRALEGLVRDGLVTIDTGLVRLTA